MLPDSPQAAALALNPATGEELTEQLNHVFAEGALEHSVGGIVRNTGPVRGEVCGHMSGRVRGGVWPYVRGRVRG